MAAAHMEFFLSATISPSTDNAQVYEIALLADGDVVAKAVYDEEDDNGLARNFAIFYKAQVPAGAPVAFEIQASTSDGGVEPIVLDAMNNNLGLQWGYRVFTDTYPLVDTPPMC